MTADDKRRRVLTVLYSLSRGIVGARVKKQALLQEVNRSGVTWMSAEQFEAYRAKVVNQHRIQEN